MDGGSNPSRATMKVMTVERVYRVKGTQLQGQLECDVQVGDIVNIGDYDNFRIFAIEYKELKDSAKAGEHVVLMFSGIKDLPIQVGCEITKDLELNIPDEFKDLPVYSWDDDHGEDEWISIGADGRLWHCIGNSNHLI
jgi:hypothetical protein